MSAKEFLLLIMGRIKKLTRVGHKLFTHEDINEVDTNVFSVITYFEADISQFFVAYIEQRSPTKSSARPYICLSFFRSMLLETLVEAV